MASQKSKQIRVYKSQISNAGVCPSHTLPRGWQLNSQGFKQGEEKWLGAVIHQGKKGSMFLNRALLLCFLKSQLNFFISFFFFPQQLHSSVRTGNLETCLRLLTLGAQANFFHPVRPSVFKSIISVFLHVFFFSVKFWLMFWLLLCWSLSWAGKGKHSFACSCKGWASISGWTVDRLWGRSWCSRQQRQNSHWLCKASLRVYYVK